MSGETVVDTHDSEDEEQWRGSVMAGEAQETCAHDGFIITTHLNEVMTADEPTGVICGRCAMAWHVRDHKDAPDFLDRALTLLQEAHDRLDDVNADEYQGPVPICNWCSEKGYGADGLNHREDCLMVRVRGFLKARET